MPKIYKPGKVALVLSGRYAGRKVVVIRQSDEGTKVSSTVYFEWLQTVETSRNSDANKNATFCGNLNRSVPTPTPSLLVLTGTPERSPRAWARRGSRRGARSSLSSRLVETSRENYQSYG
jgi:hypothetical protein